MRGGFAASDDPKLAVVVEKWLEVGEDIERLADHAKIEGAKRTHVPEHVQQRVARGWLLQNKSEVQQEGNRCAANTFQALRQGNGAMQKQQ